MLRSIMFRMVTARRLSTGCEENGPKLGVLFHFFARKMDTPTFPWKASPMTIHSTGRRELLLCVESED